MPRGRSSSFSTWKRQKLRHANIQQRPDCFWLATASSSTSMENAKAGLESPLATWMSSDAARMPFLVTARSATCWVVAPL